MRSLAANLPPRLGFVAITPSLIEASGMYNSMSPGLQHAHLRRSPLNRLITIEYPVDIIFALTKPHWVYSSGESINLFGGRIDSIS